MMFNTYSGYIIFNLLVIMRGLRESTILTQWGLLELRRIRFIPLLVGSGDSANATAGVKYFLSQAPASVWILISLSAFYSAFFNFLLTPALFFKLALPPFHGWLFTLANSVGIKELAILLTVQKFLPIHMLERGFLKGLLILSLACALGLLLFTFLTVRRFKPVMLVSSVVRSYWPVSAICSGNLWFEFLSIYSGFFVFLCYFIGKESVLRYVNALKKRGFTCLLLTLQLFNLGGVPPLAGFFIKLIIVKTLCSYSYSLLVGLLCVSFLMLYFYLQLMAPLLLMTPHQKKSKKIGSVLVWTCT
jgi:NADH:ubiquinone oxidoreductase subunit 2 (subunit N)